LFSDLLVISPPIRAKVAAFNRQLDSTSVSKPIYDPPSVPDIPYHVPNSFNAARKFFATSISLSSLLLVYITWALSGYISSSSKHLGYSGYLADMISFLLSHAMLLLMDCILF
jgi:hypothetical protein